jgi:hypothetical protein
LLALTCAHLKAPLLALAQVIGGAFQQAHPDRDDGIVDADGGGDEILSRWDVDAISQRLLTLVQNVVIRGEIHIDDESRQVACRGPGEPAPQCLQVAECAGPLPAADHQTQNQ